jgi:hypothetical protein
LIFGVKAHVAKTPKHPETLHYTGDGVFMVPPQAVPARDADATTVAGAVTFGAKTYSPIVQDIACRANSGTGKHGCGPGTHWVCVKKMCWCADCGNNGD